MAKGELSGLVGWKLMKAVRGRPKRATQNEGTATLIRRDADGTAYVRIPGSSIDTPVNGSETSSAMPGESVRYSINGGRLSITGNTSSPSVGGAYVTRQVAPALDMASDAIDQSAIARSAAESAIHDAGVAHDAAMDAQDSAVNAQESADQATSDALAANDAARSALLGLSTVEDVVDVIEWLSSHSTPSTDTEAVAGKRYYTRDPDSGSMTRVTEIEDNANPAALGWWEMDDAVTQYLAAHLAMTDNGLNVMVDGQSGYMHIGTLKDGGKYGTYILDKDSRSLARFGEHTRIGRDDSMHVDITDGSESTATTKRLFSIANAGNPPVMYIEVNTETNESTVYMTNAVVVSDLRFGNWMWYERSNGNMSVRWTGDDQ